MLRSIDSDEALVGDGGLHLFVEFDPGFRTRELLEVCSAQGVVFTPGDIFFTDGGGHHTLRLGFSRVSEDDIVKGIRIIGEAAKACCSNRRFWIAHHRNIEEDL